MKLSIKLPKILFDNKILLLNFISYLYISLWSLLPIFSYYTSNGPFRMVFFLFVIIWIVTASIHIEKKIILYVVAPFVLLFVSMLVNQLLNRSDMNLGDYANYIVLFGFIINYYYYNRISNAELNKILTHYHLLLILITSITTISVLFFDRNAARMLTSSSTNQVLSDGLQKKNVGGFGQIYGLTIILPILLYASKILNGKRIIFITITFTAILCIFLSNFTIALILMLMGIFLFFLTSVLKNTRSRIIFLIIVMIFGYNFIEIIFSFVKIRTGSLNATYKLDSLLKVMRNEVNIGNITDRYTELMISIESFIKHPLFGVGSYYRTLSSNGVGKHSQFIDDFARYGFFIGISLLLSLFVTCKDMCNLNNKNLKRIMIIVSVIYFYLGVLNPIYMFSISTFFYGVTPILIKYLNNYEKK